MKLQGYDIVFLPNQRWNTHITAFHNTATRMARDNRVLVIEPPDSLGWLRTEPAAREALTWIFDPVERKHANLYIYHTPPLFLPCQARSHWIARSVSATFEFMVRMACQQVGFRRPLFWIYQFNTVGVIRALRPIFSVYECAEEWEEYETHPQVKRYINEMDAALCREANVVIVPSRKMMEKKSSHNRNTYLVPWGVDVPLYAKARLPETPLPDDLADISHPIVGMFGMLDGRRLHVELLCYLAKRHPDWQIVLVGRCMPNLDTAPLDNLPNVHFLGMKNVNEIPAYCKAFDVCMIPYVLNNFTRSIMPLKLVEYLATGKPVVTTALPAAEELSDVMYVADSIEDFERCVLQALGEDSSKAQLRKERADKYDWDMLVKRRKEIVTDLMQKGAARP